MHEKIFAVEHADAKTCPGSQKQDGPAGIIAMIQAHQTSTIESIN